MHFWTDTNFAYSVSFEAEAFTFDILN